MSQSPLPHSHEEPAQKKPFITDTRTVLWVAGWFGLFGMGMWLSDAAHFLCELELGSNVDRSTMGSCTDPPLSDVRPAVFAIWLLPLGAAIWLLASQKRPGPSIRRRLVPLLLVALVPAVLTIGFYGLWAAAPPSVPVLPGPSPSAITWPADDINGPSLWVRPVAGRAVQVPVGRD